MIIRQVDVRDASALSELARRTYADAFGHTFSASDLAFHLEHNLSDTYFRQVVDEDVVLVADRDGRLIGFVQFGTVSMAVPAPSPGDREIRRLYVHADFQNKGAGTQLMDAALDHPLLKAAENIYKRYGFEVVGAHRLAVASGLAAERDLIMVRRSPF